MSLASKAVTLANGAIRHAVARVRRRQVASSVTVFLTLRCNCACSYCDFPRNNSGRELSTDEFRRLFRGLRSHGTFRLGISGGEPLLREDFDELALDATKLGFLTSLVTNGTLLEAHLDGARAMDYVLCTVEGDQQAHDRERGAGAYAATTRGMRLLASAGHRRFGVVCPVHQGNIDTIEETLRFAEDLKAKAFFQPAQVRDGWSGAPFERVLSSEQLVEVFAEVREWKRAGRPVGNSMTHLNWLLEGFPTGFSDQCLAGRYFHTILPDGRLIPCCMTPWDVHGVRLDVDHPGAAVGIMNKPECKGCTILPYIENTLLLRSHPSSLWNVLKW